MVRRGILRGERRDSNPRPPGPQPEARHPHTSAASTRPGWSPNAEARWRRRPCPVSLPVHCLNPCDFGAIPGTPSWISPTEIGRFAGISQQSARAELLLAMQKVEGSNPFSRFEKACICRSFSCAQSAGASASPDNDWTIVSAATRGRGQKVLLSRRFRAPSTLELLRPYRGSRVDRAGWVLRPTGR